MKILHIGPVNPNKASGVSASIIGLSKAQVIIGNSIALLPSEPPEVSKGAFYQDLVLLSNPNLGHRNPWRITDKWINVVNDKFGTPDIINFHDTYIPFHSAFGRICERADIPYVITPQGGLTHLAQNVKPIKKKIGNILFMDHFVKNAKALFATSQNEADDMMEYYPNSEIFILPNGIDEELLYLEPKMNKKNLKEFCNEDDLIVGFIGRLDVYHKGIDLLLLTIKSLQEKGYGDNIKLVMVGPFYTEADKNEIESLVNSLKYPDKVMIVGPAYGDDKWEWLKTFDVFIHTSRFEGLPVAVLEAMAFGKPCIVTPGSNIQDIITASNGGFLCDESINSIASAIYESKEKKDELPKLGDNAKTYATNNLTWQIIAQRSIKIMENIIH
jgi:glycosyltransferase involved in cell wall biosynthesis